MRDGVSRTEIDSATTELFVSLRRALGIASFGMNQITLQPRGRLRIHRHRQQEEVYLVLRGRLRLIIERDEQLELGPLELARVEASVRRQLVNPFPQPCVLVALGAYGDHEGRDGEAFADWDDVEARPPQEIPIPDPLPASE
jgi:mannose-6-phosphate isomerase-like protein (cupin superfamily)